MKFILSAILIIVAYVSLAESQATTNLTVAQRRDELLRRANYLINLVSGEVKLLQIENHELQRIGLEQELRRLVEVELELRATAVANVTTSVIAGIENNLNTIENRVQQYLNQLGQQFTTRAELDMILTRTQELLSLISDSVRRLRAQNRSLLALGLESEEARIIEIEIEIRATQNSVELRRLEETLIQNEYRIYELINELERGGARRKRDLKSDVLARANELLTLANAAVRQLRARNRTNAAEIILRRERQIQDLVTELNATTNATVVARLEGELIQLEFDLTEDLRTVGEPVDVNEYRRLLITSAQTLQQWATTEITTLTAANRTADIRVIQQEERAIAAIVTELQNATNRNTLRELESRLGESEFRLYEELLRLQRPEAYRRLLIRNAEDLAVLVLTEVRALRARNRTLEAEGLLAEETNLILLDVELRDASTVAQIQALETRLQAIEQRVNRQLVALGVRTTPVKRALKDDLIGRSIELINITNDAIADLKKQNASANGIQQLNNTEQQLQTLVAQLKNATNETQVQALEGRVLQLELNLAEELRRLGHPLDVNERRELLITRATALLQYATAQIANARNRSLEVTRIQAQETAINNTINALRNATLHSDLTTLEERLNNLENVLADELRALGQPLVPRDTIVNLQNRAEELAIRLINEIRVLRTAGRTLLAEGLQVELGILIDLDVELRVALTPQQIVSVERRLQEAETRVATELRQITGSFLF